MSLFYGVVLGGLFYLNCYSVSFGKKSVVFVITAITSFTFGVMAGRGFA
ncbi:hypothetical protein [Enterobacter cloacae]|nr:hypothetical protein [Enterobacter cloacae]MCK7380260.1 hypothetical protein [Enterobacter cloacae]